MRMVISREILLAIETKPILDFALAVREGNMEKTISLLGSISSCVSAEKDSGSGVAEYRSHTRSTRNTSNKPIRGGPHRGQRRGNVFHRHPHRQQGQHQPCPMRTRAPSALSSPIPSSTKATSSTTATCSMRRAEGFTSGGLRCAYVEGSPT